MAAPCRFFNTPNGCGYGNHCRFLHITSDVPICRYFNTPNGCIHGTKCYYKHQIQKTSVITQQNESINTFDELNESTTSVTNTENKEDTIVHQNLSRKIHAEYLIVGECRKHYNIIPYEIANIIIKYYFIEYQYLALFHSESEQIIFFGIDPIIRHTKNVKKNIFRDAEELDENDSIYALASSNTPFSINLFPKHSTHTNNNIVVRIQQYDVECALSVDEIKEDNIGNYAYCIETEELISLPCLKQKRAEQEIICTPKHGLFSIGGCALKYDQYIDQTNTIHQLIFDSNNKMSWNKCKHMNVERSNHRAIVMHDKIIIH
eukprot:524744_1